MAEEEEEEEGVEGGEKKPVEGGGESPPLSKIHVNLTENARFVASKLEDLFATVAKIQADMADLENRLRTEFDEKIRVHHELAIARITALEELCAIYGIRLDEQKKTQDQQAKQLDDLQNQVGILFSGFTEVVLVPVAIDNCVKQPGTCTVVIFGAVEAFSTCEIQ